jgi:hypothetical protein
VISNDFGRSLQAEDEYSVLKILNQAPLFAKIKGGGYIFYGP